jgi:hypothetical protein
VFERDQAGVAAPFDSDDRIARERDRPDQPGRRLALPDEIAGGHIDRDQTTVAQPQQDRIAGDDRRAPEHDFVQLVAPRAPAIGGIQPVQPAGDVRGEHALVVERERGRRGEQREHQRAHRSGPVRGFEGSYTPVRRTDEQRTAARRRRGPRRGVRLDRERRPRTLPVASSNAATTTCAVSVFRASATTRPSETATAESTRPSISSDQEIAPVSSDTAYTVPALSPTNAFVPSIVTPVRGAPPGASARPRSGRQRDRDQRRTTALLRTARSAPGVAAVPGVDALGVALADGLGDPSVVPPVSFGPGPSR